MKLLITGTAGFIGFHVAQRFLTLGHEVVGFDALTPYYDVRLKTERHRRLASMPGFRAVTGRLEDAALLAGTAMEAQPDIIIHLAAQAGVRYSLDHPREYITSNLTGTHNLLEAARAARARHLLFASSSSVYGGNTIQPFAETARTDFPVSTYAATKRGAEALTHSHAHLDGLPITCMRFFTIYGPWGRPDMALFRFVDAIENGRPLELYGSGAMTRDFTYVGDLVAALTLLVDKVPVANQPVASFDSVSPVAPWRAVNVALGRPVALLDFIAAIERATSRTAIRKMLPMQRGDIAGTSADTSLLKALVGDFPITSLDDGIAEFVQWYRSEWASRAP